MHSSIFNFNYWRRVGASDFRVRRALVFWGLGAVALIIVGAELLRFLVGADRFPSIRSAAVEALGDETEVLFLGNSVVEANIDPRAYLRSVVGLPMANGNYEVDLLLLKAHLDRLPGLRLVVFEVDVTCVGWDRLSITRDFHAFREFGISIWDLPRPWTFRASQSFLESRWVRPYIFLPRLTPWQLAWHGRSSPPARRPLPGFTPLEGRLYDYDIEPYFEREKNRHPIDTAVVERNLSSLHEAVKLVLSRDIRVAMVRYPSKGGYAFFRSEEWDAVFARLEEKIEAWVPDGVVYHNMSQDPSFETADFRDTIHLNQRGAVKLAEKLSPLIESMLGSPPTPPPTESPPRSH